MLILGLDFETTFTDPIDPKQARIIEAGAVLWDTTRQMPVKIWSQVVSDLDPTLFDDRITGLTGLTLADLQTFGRPLEKVLLQFFELAKQAEYIVAHNGTNFDKPVLESSVDRQGWAMPALKWIDSSVDVPYPKSIETRKLAFLAPSHGFLNPFSHRAVFDVLSMMKVMSYYPFEEIERRAGAKRVLLHATTEKPWLDGGKSNDLAKSRGYRFDGGRRIWTKVALDFEVAEELAKPGLSVVVLS